MPLNKPALENALLAAFASAQAGGKTQQQVAADLAAAIDTYVRSITVQTTITSGSSAGPYLAVIS